MIFRLSPINALSRENSRGQLTNKKANRLVFQAIGFLCCWGTRTRTKNDRTRICSVTITPYPNGRNLHHLDD